jgi:riboflavin synthase
MFTGLIQHVSQVESHDRGHLSLVKPVDVQDWKLGESIAVNGVCLTIVGHEATLDFDLSEETYRRSTLGELVTGDLVNLERAMQASDRFGGHLVQGHVDSTGQITSIEEVGGFWTFEFEAGLDSMRYLIDKGSVTVDGISLTVVSPKAGRFRVAVIPHTFSATSLRAARVGQPVNLEFDVIAKHVENLLRYRDATS